MFSVASRFSVRRVFRAAYKVVEEEAASVNGEMRFSSCTARMT